MNKLASIKDKILVSFYLFIFLGGEVSNSLLGNVLFVSRHLLKIKCHIKIFVNFYFILFIFVFVLYIILLLEVINSLLGNILFAGRFWLIAVCILGTDSFC